MGKPRDPKDNPKGGKAPFSKGNLGPEGKDQGTKANKLGKQPR